MVRWTGANGAPSRASDSGRGGWRREPGAGDGETSSISDDGESCEAAMVVQLRRTAAAGVRSAASGHTGPRLQLPGSMVWVDDSKATPEDSAAVPESAVVLRTDRWSLRQEQAEMSETETGAGEEPESRLRLWMSKDSMEPRETSDLEVLAAVDMEDSWMCSTSRGSGWASGARARESVHGGIKGGA